MDRQQRTGLEIGLIAHGWFPDVGGVQSHMRDLARELRSRGHRVHALCLDTQEGLEPFSHEIDTVEGVQVRRVAYRYHDHRALADLVHNGDMERCARDWAEASSLDVVHVHHLTGFGLSVLRSLRELDLPVVMTLHDYWPLCPRGQMLQTSGEVCQVADPETCARCLLDTWPHLMPSADGEARGPEGESLEQDGEAAHLRTRYALDALGRAHRLFTPSEASRLVYVRAGIPEDRIEVVENGIDVDELAMDVRRLRAVREGEVPVDEIRLGILGTVLPSKGALELARAFQAAKVPEMTLEIHGDMPSYHGDSSYLEKLHELAAADRRIRIHGPYTHDRLPEILAGLDGVAAPSRWCEVFGLTVREARAAGLPVMVSDAGALAAVADEGRAGVVVSAEDHEGWIAALKQFANYRSRASWRKHKTMPRTSRDMMLQLERAYAETIREVRGEEPQLLHPAGEDDPESRGRARREAKAQGLLTRFFGRNR